MSRRLKKIGTAIFDIVGFINFRLQETNPIAYLLCENF